MDYQSKETTRGVYNRMWAGLGLALVLGLSCREIPRDNLAGFFVALAAITSVFGGFLWAAVHGVKRARTDLRNRYNLDP